MLKFEIQINYKNISIINKFKKCNNFKYLNFKNFLNLIIKY